MASHKHRQAQVALAIGKSQAETSRNITRTLKLIRGENNDLWEMGLQQEGVPDAVIRKVAKFVRDQQSELDDKFIRQETGFIR